MHPKQVMRRPRDALDDDLDLLQQWMPARPSSLVYADYVDFSHRPVPVATKHAAKRRKERKHITGCVKAKYVPGTNNTLVATVVPCRASNATRMHVPPVRRKVRKLCAAAKTQGAKAQEAYARLHRNIHAVRAHPEPPPAPKKPKKLSKRQRAVLVEQLAEAKRAQLWDRVDDIEAQMGRSLQIRLAEARRLALQCKRTAKKARWEAEVCRLRKKLGQHPNGLEFD